MAELFMDRKIFTVLLPIPVTVHCRDRNHARRQFSEKTAEDLLFNKSLPLSSYKKSALH